MRQAVTLLLHFSIPGYLYTLFLIAYTARFPQSLPTNISLPKYQVALYSL